MEIEPQSANTACNIAFPAPDDVVFTLEEVANILMATFPDDDLLKLFFQRAGVPVEAKVEHSDPKAFFCQEEIFGPFVTLETFDSEEQAIAQANDTMFGLSASVWTHDGARAFRVARALRNGTVWINDHNKLFAEAETGGYRQSGLGRLHGYDALADFTEIKHICMPAGVVGGLTRLTDSAR